MNVSKIGQPVPVNKLKLGEKKHKVVKKKGVLVKVPVPVTASDIWSPMESKKKGKVYVHKRH